MSRLTETGGLLAEPRLSLVSQPVNNMVVNAKIPIVILLNIIIGMFFDCVLQIYVRNLRDRKDSYRLTEMSLLFYNELLFFGKITPF